MTNLYKVDVFYNDVLIGTLKEIENQIFFKYDKNWLIKGFSISPFSLPLEDKVFSSTKDDFGGLYGVFYDSLSDGRGYLVTNRYLIKKGINPKKVNILTRLCLLGDNALGALSYKPSIELENNNFLEIDFDKIKEEIDKLEYSEDVTYLDYLFETSGASNGARPKLHIKFNNEDWIVKFPLKRDGLSKGIEEYRFNTLARKCDIEVSDFKLFPSRISEGYFATKRFDRKNGKKIHVISLSALLEIRKEDPFLDYLNLLDVTYKLTQSDEEVLKVFKLMVFNIFIKNHDDHAKNFSFLYDEDKKSYIFAPAYDLTTEKYVKEHEMTVARNGNPTKKEIYEVAKYFNISVKQVDKIIYDIENNYVFYESFLP